MRNQKIIQKLNQNSILTNHSSHNSIKLRFPVFNLKNDRLKISFVSNNSSLNQNQSHLIHLNQINNSFNPIQTSNQSYNTSSADLDYLNQLSISISNHSLSPVSLSQALKYLQSHGLFNLLSSNSFNLLLDYNPTTLQEEPSSRFYLYQRIFFLLDRIYELDHLFTKLELDQFHSISLKQFSQFGMFRPAELIWDQLIIPNSSKSQPRPQDQILMIDCIRNAFFHQQSSQTLSHSTNLSIDRQTQDLLSLTSKDVKRMLNLCESIGHSLFESTQLDTISERWIVRTVSEIFGIRMEESKLAKWLMKVRCLNMEFPDQGASWTDPRLTAIVIKMFKDQGKLENMISIYETASHPSPSMLSHHATRAMNQNSIFDSESSETIHPSNPQPLTTKNGPRKRNPILTRTYHDLISAANQANRPHLAIHFLTQALERNESYVQNTLLKHPPNVNFPSTPALRLQPATFSELISSLIRKKRDTQLKTILQLTHRLVRSTVEELNWIKSWALNRSSVLPSEESKCRTIINSIAPQFNNQQDTSENLESAKAQNLALEKIVFTYRNQPSKLLLPNTSATTNQLDQQKLENDLKTHDDQNEGAKNIPQHANFDLSKQPNDQEEEEINLLRVLERTKFLSKTLFHSIKLIQNLDPIIRKTKINRAIRFESNLLNQKIKSVNHQDSKPFNFFNSKSPPLSSTPVSNAVHVDKIRLRIESLKLQKKNHIHFNSNS